jgi:hypothetical protein
VEATAIGRDEGDIKGHGQRDVVPVVAQWRDARRIRVPIPD